jgi:molybdate/tungstate transport system substrate-binding protein
MRRSRFLASLGAAPLTLGVCAAARAKSLEPVVVLYAGSLVTIMENAVKPALVALGLEFQGEAKGSLALANLIRAGLRKPDVFVSADPKVLDGLMTAEAGHAVHWYATFAATRLVVGYAPASPFARDFVLAARGQKHLPDVLLAPDIRIGRTDPALDPKGYRTIIAVRLMEKYGNAPADFAKRLLGTERNPAQVVPEETLLARLEGGDLDAAFLYANEALSRKLPFVELPKSANLGDPAEASLYATQTVTIDEVAHRGALSVYAVTIPDGAPNPRAAETFVDFLCGGASGAGSAILGRAGLTLLPPHISGEAKEAPASLRALAQ